MGARTYTVTPPKRSVSIPTIQRKCVGGATALPIVTRRSALTANLLLTVGAMFVWMGTKGVVEKFLLWNIFKELHITRNLGHFRDTGLSFGILAPMSGWNHPKLQNYHSSLLLWVPRANLGYQRKSLWGSTFPKSLIRLYQWKAIFRSFAYNSAMILRFSMRALPASTQSDPSIHIFPPTPPANAVGGHSRDGRSYLRVVLDWIELIVCGRAG
ncbi:hypothetical protein C8R44DRAFT_753386 [Mycena epipterygia]|nr:hypothetical protein C8R44DRAFT_753386 [Mycena epipterygia]